MSQPPVTVAVFGASGYTGAELVRLLTQHPGVKLTHMTSRRYAGKPVSDLFPNLDLARAGLVFAKHNPAGIAREVQAAFLCLPSDTHSREGDNLICRECVGTNTQEI